MILNYKTGLSKKAQTVTKERALNELRHIYPRFRESETGFSKPKEKVEVIVVTCWRGYLTFHPPHHYRRARIATCPPRRRTPPPLWTAAADLTTLAW